MASLVLLLQAMNDAYFSSSAHRLGQRRAVPGVEVMDTCYGILSSLGCGSRYCSTPGDHLQRAGRVHGSGVKYSISCRTREAENELEKRDYFSLIKNVTFQDWLKELTKPH